MLANLYWSRKMDKYAQIMDAFLQLDEKRVISLVKEALNEKTNGYETAKKIVSTLEQGMLQIGKMYEEGTYFIADLIMSGIIFKEIFNLSEIEEYNVHNCKNIYMGTIIIGSVQTDKHDIGKDLFKKLAVSSGLNVIDLGIDVPVEKFAEAIIRYHPDILCLSALLTSAVKNFKNTVEYLEQNNLRHDVKILIAGNPLTKELCEYIGADEFTKSVSDGLNICLDWLTEKNKLK